MVTLLTLHDVPSLQETKHLIQPMMKKIRVLIYNGVFDLQDGPVGTEHLLLSLNIPGWSEAPRNLWFTGDSVAGYVQEHGNLSFVLVHGAGHFVPTDQEEVSLAMFDTFVNNRNGGLYCVPGTTIPVRFSALTPSGLHKYLIHDPDEDQYILPCEMSQLICSNMLNECEGHGKCVQGRCECEEGYVGDSCAFKIQSIDNKGHNAPKNQKIDPQDWQYFSIADGTAIADKMLTFKIRVEDKDLASVGDTIDPFIGRGLGGIMPANRLCLYGKQQLGSEHVRSVTTPGLVPKFADFDFVHCFDASRTSTSSFTTQISTAEDGKGQWTVGVFNAHPFTLNYSFTVATADVSQPRHDEL